MRCNAYFKYSPSKKLMLVEVTSYPPSGSVTTTDYEISQKVMKEIERNMTVYRSNLYERLKSRDNEQYVWIEPSPNTGFMRALPKSPKYDPRHLRVWRSWVLESIESLEQSVFVVSTADPATGKVKTQLCQYTRLRIAKWVLKPSSIKRDSITDFIEAESAGSFFIPKLKEV